MRSGKTGETQAAQTEATKAKTKFSPFEQTREYVHNLGLKTEREYAKWAKSGTRPSYIPSNPNVAYKKEWKGWGDWLGTGTIAPQNRKYRSFEEAREFTHSLLFEKYIQWREYCKSGRKPKDVPQKPDVVYKEWKGWKNWLGTEFLPFEEARKIVKSIGLKSRVGWDKWCKSGKKPKNIPRSPR